MALGVCCCAQPAPPACSDQLSPLIGTDANPSQLQEAALAELEGESSALREALAAAEAEGARAGALEGSLATSKDQYIRLTADFENFRRRTVRPLKLTLRGAVCGVQSAECCLIAALLRACASDPQVAHRQLPPTGDGEGAAVIPRQGRRGAGPAAAHRRI